MNTSCYYEGTETDSEKYLPVSESTNMSPFLPCIVKCEQYQAIYCLNDISRGQRRHMMIYHIIRKTCTCCLIVLCLIEINLYFLAENCDLLASVFRFHWHHASHPLFHKQVKCPKVNNNTMPQKHNIFSRYPVFQDFITVTIINSLLPWRCRTQRRRLGRRRRKFEGRGIGKNVQYQDSPKPQCWYL